jgi:hypothetical protein
MAFGATLTNAAPAMAAGHSTAAPSLAVTRPVSVDEYVRRMPPSGDSTAQTTTLSGVHDEYRTAVSIFPLQLPAGYAFPAQSSATDPAGAPGSRFSAGTGAAEAYFFWQNATAAAAYSAFLQGDHARSHQLLNALEAGYATGVRRMYWQDLNDGFLVHSIEPGHNGNFLPLRLGGLNEFTGSPIFRAIAEMAGDGF